MINHLPVINKTNDIKPFAINEIKIRKKSPFKNLIPVLPNNPYIVNREFKHDESIDKFYKSKNKSKLCKKYLVNPGELFGLEKIRKEEIIKRTAKLDKFIKNYCKFSDTKLQEINYNPIETPKTKELESGILKTLFENPIYEIKPGIGMILHTIIEYLKIKYKNSNVCFLNPGLTNEISEINTINFSLTFNSKNLDQYKIFSNKKQEEKQRNYIEKCKKRFVFGYFILRIQKSLKGNLEINEKENFHLNSFIYDKTKNLFELFEPLGYLETLNDFPTTIIYNEIQNELGKVLPINFKFKVVDIDFQYKEEEIERKRSVIDPFGFCAYWSAWALEQKLKNPIGSFRNLLIAKKKTLGDFRRYIRGFALLMNKIFIDYIMLSSSLIEITKDNLEINQKILEFIVKTYILTLKE